MGERKLKIRGFTLNFPEMAQIIGIFISILFLMTLIETYYYVDKPSVFQLTNIELGLEVNQTGKEKMVAALVKINEKKGVQFSNYFEALSKRRVKGIWYTRLKFMQQGEQLILEGHAWKKELLARLVNQFNQKRLFKRDLFHDVKMNTKKKGTEINFILETLL